MAAKDSGDPRDDGELSREIARGLHDDIVTAPDGSVRSDPPRQSIFDCP